MIGRAIGAIALLAFLAGSAAAQDGMPDGYSCPMVRSYYEKVKDKADLDTIKGFLVAMGFEAKDIQAAERCLTSRHRHGMR